MQFEKKNQYDFIVTLLRVCPLFALVIAEQSEMPESVHGA